MTRTALQNTSNRFQSIQQLINAIPTAGDEKAILDLQATKGTSGTISGTVDLNPQQLQDLQNARLYIQLHSEKAPDGNLWGWLMPQETKR